VVYLALVVSKMMMKFQECQHERNGG